jgi:hypothetical protein
MIMSGEVVNISKEVFQGSSPDLSGGTEETHGHPSQSSG